MILCDCCGRKIHDGESATRRTIPGTLSKENPYGQMEDWCSGCENERSEIENELRNLYRKQQMKEYYERINALIAKKRRGHKPYEFDYENCGCNPPEPDRGPERESAPETETEEPGAL